MGVLYEKLPDNIKEQIIKPYISIKDNEARITMRIKDSQKKFMFRQFFRFLPENMLRLLAEKTLLGESQGP